MEEKSIGFRYRARYYRSGTLNTHTREVWVVLHGYGQLAQYFIKKFHSLEARNICVLAPEGLSRFYLSPLTDTGRPDNKVGSTWMTRENRLMDIENYVAYLDAVFEKELAGFEHIPVTILAFSQGCATACRWITQGKPRFSRLVLWAGLFPPDMDFTAGQQILSKKKTIMVTGNQDPYVTQERITEFDEMALKLGINPEKIIFDGKHEMKDEVLIAIADDTSRAR